MDVLIVGAGALGQPLGYHLSRGGADVTFLVKDKYREACEEGFRLHRHYLWGGPEHTRFRAFDVRTSVEAVEGGSWDQVWLCISSPALRGNWLPELLEATEPETLVSIQPGLRDREYLEARYPADQIVSVRVTMLAYHTPLPGESLPEGEVAYFLPPAQPLDLGGARGAAESVVGVLDDGECPARVRNELLSYTAFNSALLETAIAGLELADWSLDDFRCGDALDLAMEAASEGLEIVGAKFDATPPLSMRLGTKTALMRFGLPLAAVGTPFDLEAYLRTHFTKVGDQTRADLRTYIETGTELDLSTDALETLLGQLETLDR